MPEPRRPILVYLPTGWLNSALTFSFKFMDAGVSERVFARPSHLNSLLRLHEADRKQTGFLVKLGMTDSFFQKGSLEICRQIYIALYGLDSRKFNSRLFSFEKVLEAAVDAFGEEDDQKDEGQPVDNLRKAHKGAAVCDPEVFLQGNDQKRAHRGAPEPEHAPQDGLESYLQRRRDSGEGMGVEIGD